MADRIRNGVMRGLEQIQIRFDEMMAERERFFNNFEEWTCHRRLTLLELEKFQKELNTIHQYGNAGRAVGNGATVLGSLATIIGIGLSFSKDLRPIGNELMKYGSGISTAGSVASLSSSLAETGFSAKVLSDVKAALKKDNQLTEELLPWFEKTQELDSALNEVFDCGLTDGIREILALIYEIHSIYQSGGEMWDRIQGYLLPQVSRAFSINSLQALDNEKLKKILCNASYKVKQLLVEFCNDPSVRKASWAIYETFRKNPVSFDLSKISIRIVRKITMHQSVSAASFTSSCWISSASLSLQGFLKTASFALSVLAFVSTVNDIKEGRSKYDAIIERVKVCLKEELESLELYPMLRR